MAIVVHQSPNTGGGTPGGATFSTSFVSLPGVGDAVIVGFGIRGTATATGVADNQGVGNTYTKIQQVFDGFSADDELWWCPAIGATSGTFTVTVTMSASGGSANGGWMMGLLDVSGISATVDHSANSFSGSGVTSASVTNGASNTNANCLVVTNIACAQFNTTPTISDPPATGYTSWYVDQGALSSTGMDAGYKIVTSVETSAASWTFGANSFNWSSCISTFGAGAPSNSATIAWVS